MYKLMILAYVTVIFLVFGFQYRKSKQEWWLRFVLASALPVVGLLLPLFWSKSWHKRNARNFEKHGMYLFENLEYDSTNLSGLYRLPESEKEMNVIPLEEALLVNDLSTRRRAVIDLLKKDSLDYLEVLQLAVDNEDTETSHYAVSAIMEVKRKLTLALQEMAVKYEENRNDPYMLQSYADILKGYIRSGFHDERSLLKYKYTYSNILGQYLELVKDSPKAYMEKIDTDLVLREFATAESMAVRFIEQLPNNEDAYLSLIKVYYAMRSRSQFNQALERMKRSPVRMSNRAISIVRFWSEGVQHAG